MTSLSDSVQVSSRIGTGWGFAVVILGVLAIMTPFVAGIAVNTILAVVVAAAGLTITTYAFKAGSFGKGLLQFLSGGITAVCGVFMFMQPMVSMMTLTGVLLIYFVVDGIFSVISGFRSKPAQGWVWIVVSGVSSIVLAVFLWIDWPVSGTYAIGILVGIRLIFAGWSIAMLGAIGDSVGEVLKADSETAENQAEAPSNPTSS